MAAVTPATTNRINMGSVNMLVANFTAVSDTDTWTSGMGNVVSYQATVNGNPGTQTSSGTAVTQAAGVFTFYPGTDALGCVLWVVFE